MTAVSLEMSDEPYLKRFPRIPTFLARPFSVLSHLICLIIPPKYINRLLNVFSEKNELFPLPCRITLPFYPDCRIHALILVEKYLNYLTLLTIYSKKLP